MGNKGEVCVVIAFFVRDIIVEGLVTDFWGCC